MLEMGIVEAGIIASHEYFSYETTKRIFLHLKPICTFIAFNLFYNGP